MNSSKIVHISPVLAKFEWKNESDQLNHYSLSVQFVITSF